MSGERLRVVGLELDAIGQGRVTLDEMDVSHLVRAVTLNSGVGETTVVEVELVGAFLSRTAAYLRVAADTHALLLDLGWTPPPWLALRRHLDGRR